MARFGPKPRTLEERFWPKVKKTSGCWEWVAATNGAGYGMVFAGKVKKLAHRVSWELCNGPIPRGKQVLHLCDNPGCVNPEHLAIGTAKDNMRDMAGKGRARNRTASGTHNRQAKLSAAQARAIREQYLSGESQHELAIEFGVSRAAISHVVTGRNWNQPAHSGYLTQEQARGIREKYATSDSTQAQIAAEYGVSQTAVGRIVRGIDHAEAGGPISSGRAKKRSILREDQVQEIRELYAAGGVTYSSLAEDYGVSKSCICSVVERRNWKDV